MRTQLQRPFVATRFVGVALLFSILVAPAELLAVSGKAAKVGAQAKAPALAARGALDLPEGFRAEVFADGLGRARHLVVGDDGVVYVALREVHEGGGIVALQDSDGDGRADRSERFAKTGGTGIALHEGWLYFSSADAVFRARRKAGSLLPPGPVEVVVSGFPEQRSHDAKSIAFDDQGRLYVNVGAPSNACQKKKRKKEKKNGNK